MTYIPDALRQRVIERAQNCCEYCRIHQRDSLYTHEIDHIIPEKHRGTTTADNLCLSCLDCNRSKGSDFASFDPDTNIIVSLFNPRIEIWSEHFRLENVYIAPLTAQGRVTVFVLKLNDSWRVQNRKDLMEIGHYPTS
jgi:hypothetical protein